MIKVYIRIWFSTPGVSFAKVIKVWQIPSINNLLKICNHSFKVYEVEHDIDAYEGEHYEYGQFCDSISVEPNVEMTISKEELPNLFKELLKNGWTKNK